MTSAQVVETSVTNNSSFQNYPHPDDHTIRTIIIIISILSYSKQTPAYQQKSPSVSYIYRIYDKIRDCDWFFLVTEVWSRGSVLYLMSIAMTTFCNSRLAERDGVFISLQLPGFISFCLYYLNFEGAAGENLCLQYFSFISINETVSNMEL